MTGVYQTYKQLPLCIDQSGHRFKLDVVTGKAAVCERCGLISKQVVR